MPRMLGLVLALGFLLLTAERGRADDRAKALEVLQQAIQAHGGDERLAKARLMNRTGKGILSLFGKESPFTTERTMSMPERLRDQIEFEADGVKTRVILVVNGAKGWQLTGGASMELPKERVVELQEELHVVWLSTLVPLKDKGFTLAPLPEAKVIGLPASGIIAKSKGHTDVKLFFDKKTNLLVKIERQALEAGLTVLKEYYYTNHKEFEGVKLETRYIETINGNKSTELTITSYKFPSKIDDNTFAKP